MYNPRHNSWRRRNPKEDARYTLTLWILAIVMLLIVVVMCIAPEIKFWDWVPAE